MNASELYKLYSDRDLEGLLSVCRQVAEDLTNKIIRSPADCAELLMCEMGHLEQEELWVVLLNTRNAVMKVHKLYRGSTNASMVRIGELFREAVRQNATSIIISYNHPSGDPAPSPEDVGLTKSVYEAGKILDIELLDP
jgi:DNA repair protein RadC